jgi:spore maturation protein CgeB
MRISIIGSSDFDTLEYHIADSFTHMGHKVANFDYPHVIPLNRYQKYELHSRRLSDPYCKIISEKVAKKVIKSAPDLIIATYRDIHPAGIDLIRKEVHNIPIIHINPDALTTFERQQVFVSDYDFYFSR